MLCQSNRMHDAVVLKLIAASCYYYYSYGHLVSEVTWLIVTEFCHVLVSVYNLQMNVNIFGGLSPKIFVAKSFYHYFV